MVDFFDDFDLEDAAILGGAMGFAEESAREENRKYPSKIDDHDEMDLDARIEDKISARRQFQLLANDNPELARYIVEKALEYRRKARANKEYRKFAREVEQEFENIRKQEQEGKKVEYDEATLNKWLNQWRKLYYEDLGEEDFEKYPDLYLIDEAAGQGWRIKIDYVYLNGKLDRDRIIIPQRVFKRAGVIYLDAFFEHRGEKQTFRYDRIKNIGSPKDSPSSDASREKATSRNSSKYVKKEGQRAPSGTPGEKVAQGRSPKYHLRSEPLTVSNKELKGAFRLDDDLCLLEHIDNNFKDNGDGTVTDHATGLMWQKAGSDRIDYDQALAYIEELNDKRFASCNDWRLPTVEELTSLLKPAKQSSGLYIAPIFDSEQWDCWSVDKRSSIVENFVVVFSEAENFILPFSFESTAHVRAVRSCQGNQSGSRDLEAQDKSTNLQPEDYKENPDLFFFEKAIEKKYRIKIDCYDLGGKFYHDRIIWPQHLYKLGGSVYLRALCELEGDIRNFLLSYIMNVRIPNQSTLSNTPVEKPTSPNSNEGKKNQPSAGMVKITIHKEPPLELVRIEPPQELVRILNEECRDLPTVKEVIFDAFNKDLGAITGAFYPDRGILFIDLGNCFTNQMWIKQGMLRTPGIWFNMLWTLFHEIAHARQLLEDHSLIEKNLLPQALEDAADRFAVEKISEWTKKNPMPKFKDLGWAGRKMKIFLNQTYGAISEQSAEEIEEYELGLVANVERIRERRDEKYFPPDSYKKLCEIIDKGEAGTRLNNKRYLNANEFFSIDLILPTMPLKYDESTLERDKKKASEGSIAKTLANRIKMELGLEVFIDDVDTYIGIDGLIFLLNSQKLKGRMQIGNWKKF